MPPSSWWNKSSKQSPRSKKQNEEVAIQNGNPGLCCSVTSHFLLAMGDATSPGALVPFPWPPETRTDFSLRGSYCDSHTFGNRRCIFCAELQGTWHT
jgi:hypothetical protein